MGEPQTNTPATTRRMDLKIPVKVSTKLLVFPIWAQVSKGFSCLRVAYTDQKQAGKIQQEGHGSVDYQDNWPDSAEVFHLEGCHLGEPDQDEVHEGTHGGVVVQANHGVHLLAISREEDLGHDQTDCFEANCTHLAPEPDPLELNLASTS